MNAGVNGGAFGRSPSRRALGSPRSVSGRLASPVCCPESVQVVSPCRATYVLGSLTGPKTLADDSLSHALNPLERLQGPCRRNPEPRRGRRGPYGARGCSRSIGCRCHGRCDEASAMDIRHVPSDEAPIVRTRVIPERSVSPYSHRGTMSLSRNAAVESREHVERSSRGHRPYDSLIERPSEQTVTRVTSSASTSPQSRRKWCSSAREEPRDLRGKTSGS